jgi:tetratricopeptide (TPR) repeat protein
MFSDRVPLGPIFFMANLEELIGTIHSTKSRGLNLYTNGQYEEAILMWKEAAKLLLKAVCSGPEALANADLSLLDHKINSNLAMAHYKIKDFSNCVFFCDKALLRRKTMPDSLIEKNLYRKASAEYELCNFEECRDTCKDLVTSFPGNAAGAQLLRTVERDISSEERTQRQTYSKMFEKLEVENRKVGCLFSYDLFYNRFRHSL